MLDDRATDALNDGVVAITGAGSGIGEARGVPLAARDAKIVLVERARSEIGKFDVLSGTPISRRSHLLDELRIDDPVRMIELNVRGRLNRAGAARHVRHLPATFESTCPIR